MSSGSSATAVASAARALGLLDAKTVNVRLSPEAAPLYQAASLQFRKLKVLLVRLEKLSQTILRLQAKLAQSRHPD